MRLDATKPPTHGTTHPADTTKPPRPGTEGFTPSMHKYLTADEMNSLKQAEWPSDDSTVKVTFGNAVNSRYIVSANENAAQFNALSPIEQAARILEKGKADERKDVRITNDPAPLADYKRMIQPVILSNCATAGCHGGPNGGKFFLYNTPEND